MSIRGEKHLNDKASQLCLKHTYMLLLLLLMLLLLFSMPFFMLSATMCRIVTSEILIIFLFILGFANVLSLGALRRLKPSEQMAVYSMERSFLLRICYMRIFLLSKSQLLTDLR